MTVPANTNAGAGAMPAADLWPRPDGTPLDCREKLRLLRENQAEVVQVLRDCFDDAILMGVDADAMRHRLHGLVDALRDPRGGGSRPR